MALAPSLLLLGVPSASIISASTAIWSAAAIPSSRGPEHLVHVADRLAHALADVALRVAVAQLDRLVLAGGGAARHRGAALRAARQHDVGLDGGIAAAVEDLAGVHFDDRAHGRSGYGNGPGQPSRRLTNLNGSGRTPELERRGRASVGAHAVAVLDRADAGERDPGGGLERARVGPTEVRRQGHQQLVVLATLRGELLRPECSSRRASAIVAAATGTARDSSRDAHTGRRGEMAGIGAETVAQVEHGAGPVGARASGPPRSCGSGCA